jgi:hypothetical protein
MQITNFTPYVGQHCETTATGTLLKRIGIDLSEPMLFGLGEGLSFIYWNMKTMDHPFLGGRVKPDALTQNIVKNLGLEMTVNETSSRQKAWDNVQKLVEANQVVGLKLDSFYLEYFSKPIHFAGHYVALYGYDEESAYLVDTDQQGGQVKTSLKSLALARSEKGPMSSRNLYYVIGQPVQKYDLGEATRNALRNNARDYLNPPITNISYKGIKKAASEIIKWFEKAKDVETEFTTVAMLMERAGTGGALFRNLYRDFLKECFEIHKTDNLLLAHQAFVEIATSWRDVSSLLHQAGVTHSIEYVRQASKILREISTQEKQAMELLMT